VHNKLKGLFKKEEARSFKNIGELVEAAIGEGISMGDLADRIIDSLSGHYSSDPVNVNCCARR
jgi:hypothetical protein